LLSEAAFLVSPAGDEACAELDSAVDLALALALDDNVSGLDLNLHKAAECASGLLGSAACGAECGDEALSEINAAVLLAFTLVLNFNGGDVVLDGEDLETVKCACALGLEASLGVEGGDHALSEGDAAVLLAGSHVSLFVLNVLNNWLVVLGNESDSLKAVECAGSLLLSACLHVEGLDKALSSVDTAVLLACAHLALDLGGNSVMVLTELDLN